jgi:mRNA interferase HigB
MRVIKTRTLSHFWRTHPAAEPGLRAWLDAATKATWSTPSEIRAFDRSASFLVNNRVVFNIAENRFRLVVSVAYNFQAMF